MSRTGRPVTYTTEPCSSCAGFLSLSDVHDKQRQCRKCRIRGPISPPRWKVDKPHSTETSVWETAARDGFTATMAKHFSGLGSGVSYYSDITQKGGKRLLRKMVAGR